MMRKFGKKLPDVVLSVEDVERRQAAEKAARRDARQRRGAQAAPSAARHVPALSSGEVAGMTEEGTIVRRD
jgi:hypothetical protein